MSDPIARPAQAPAYASWPARVGAVIVDSVPTAVVLVLLAAAFGDLQITDRSFLLRLTGVPSVVHLLFSLAWFVYNWVVRQGSTGQTIGKKLLGISVLGASSGQPVGGGMTVGRQVAHVLDALPCGLGFLWPLWDAENRTFADMITDTRVYRT